MAPASSLNPLVGFSDLDYLVYHLSYDFLVGVDPVTLGPRPEYAESWRSSQGGRVWTFQIRRGMEWHDGTPATAYDVAYTFDFLMKNRIAAYAMYTTSIKSVKALGRYTVRFDCTQPKADILQMTVPILPRHIWSRLRSQEATTSFQNGPPTVGSGPFHIVALERDSHVRLVANRSYWRGAPSIHDLYFQWYQNPATMADDLESGDIDAAIDLPPVLFEHLASGTIEKNAGVSWMMAQLSFNCSNSRASTGNRALLDEQFRRALQFAVDRETISSLAFGGFFEKGDTILPGYSLYAWDHENHYEFDAQRSRDLLDAAGYVDVNGDSWRDTRQGQPLTLRLSAPTDNPPMLEVGRLVAGCLQAVGVRVRLEALTTEALVARITNRRGGQLAPDFDVYVGTWQGGADPQFILGLLTPEQVGMWNDTSWTDSLYTNLFEEQSSAIDAQRRSRLIGEMQQIVHEASPYVVFGYPQRLEAYNTVEWEGYVPVPRSQPGRAGSVLSLPDQVDTYIGLRPTGRMAPRRDVVSIWKWAVASLLVGAVTVAVLGRCRTRARAEVTAVSDSTIDTRPLPRTRPGGDA